MAFVKNKKHIIILPIFCIFLFINFCQPLVMDDFWRSNINALYNSTILINLYHDYFHWTGRMSAQIPVYLFFNKSYPFSIALINFINAFAMTSLIIYLYKNTIKDKYNVCSKSFIIYLSLFLLYFFNSRFIATATWKTAGIQYLWGLSLLVYIFNKLYIKNISQRFASVIYGIILGCYNEAFFMVIFTIIFYYIIFEITSRKKLNINTLFFFIPFIVSGILLIIAPGSYVRTGGILDGQTLFSYLISHFIDFIILFTTKLELSVPFLLSIILTLIYEKDTKSKVFICLGLTSISFTMFFIMFGLSTRVEMIYMVVYFYICCKYFLNIRLINHLKYLYLLCLAIVAFYSYQLFSAYLEMGIDNQIRNQEIIEYQENNIKDAVVSNYFLSKQNDVYYYELAPFKSNWYNQQFAEYYDFDSIVAEH
ncbi:DUF6056 family protein [Francisella adeliensis]|uniref:Glycosyltransferase RgtA/B/C/D-like domain-containing protein n=1 Tax=Francisella adeliensis TaxID=2007306 RepID=A0A2Z4XXG6_9GAMM|nr:DUF6056 family protein [Francisella adeliensis]AXA33581.1 hypothetical protein CDH04_03780 [Francisella adeliensis]MBK2085177.1 hypothetical protein [Francisella adeliensis]MBK2097346.1 hypothetical protein [Francisella adeliensis]QIW11813.1 hypothetical protein FZC43_03780 [Francisella adeliensis]QIW13689.1 hypothetical protein FZC44_03780 [Francisella adeliensis]